MRFDTVDLGLCRYTQALDLQKRLWQQVAEGSKPSTAVICSHYPVLTLGRSAKHDNLRSTPAELKKLGIELFACERGGDITYHGPGQLVCYPVCDLRDLRDLHAFIRGLEELIICLLADFGVKAHTRKGLTGAWVGHLKIASLGIAVRQWVSFHGFSLNVLGDDLENFSLIRPCGMDIRMTCVQEQVHGHVSFEDLKQNLIRRLRYGQCCLAGTGAGDR